MDKSQRLLASSTVWKSCDFMPHDKLFLVNAALVFWAAVEVTSCYDHHKQLEAQLLYLQLGIVPFI